jgi:hypothetical protein
MNPPRIPLYDFPDVMIHADELTVKRHPQFQAAKGGDIVAAGLLVAALASPDCMATLASSLQNRQVELVPVHALESAGVNEIPIALAKYVAKQLRISVNESIVQVNSVGHTGASGFHRLAHQARFIGNVVPERQYFLVDDFVGQGGTLANLIGFIHANGGSVLGATVLTGKPYSVKLAPDLALVQALRNKHGKGFEDWWRQEFGFGFDCLTRSETRYLEKSPDADTIRDRLAAARFEGGELGGWA